MACEETGNTECTKGEHIIENRLYRCQYVWVNDELQDTIGHTRRDADRRTEKEARQHREEHRAQGDGATGRELKHLDHRGDRRKCDAYRTVNQNLDIF